MATSKNTRQPTGHIAPFGLRLQPDLKARAEESAARNGRSLNAEIAQILHDHYQRQAIEEKIVDDPDNSKIFISHSSADVDLLELFKKSLEENARARLLMNRQLDLLTQVVREKADRLDISNIDPDELPDAPTKRIRRTLPPKDH